MIYHSSGSEDTIQITLLVKVFDGRDISVVANNQILKKWFDFDFGWTSF